MSQTVTRALRLLAELGEGERSLDQLAELIGVHKTTVLRLLQSLEEQRFVHRDADFRYHLGAGLFALSSLALEQRGIRRTAAPHLAELNAATGHTVHLAAYEGGEVVYIDKYDSRHPVRMYSRIGLRAGLHNTAVAKVLLADLPPAERRRVAEAVEYTVHTANTLTTPARAAHRTGDRRRPGLGAGPRRARAVHQLHRRAGPGRHRPGGRRGVDVGAGHGAPVRPGAGAAAPPARHRPRGVRRRRPPSLTCRHHAGTTPAQRRNTPGEKSR